MDLNGLTAATGVCPLCGGVGWVLDSSDGRKQAHPCVCRAAGITKARLDAAGIPQRYRDCTLENFSDIKQGDLIEAFVTERVATEVFA